MSAAARQLGLSWGTCNQLLMDACRQMLAGQGPARLAGVGVIGVDEHRWAHTHHAGGRGFVTVIVGMTPVVTGTGPARLLDMVPGRPSVVLQTWLNAHHAELPYGPPEHVCMDGFPAIPPPHRRPCPRQRR